MSVFGRGYQESGKWCTRGCSKLFVIWRGGGGVRGARVVHNTGERSEPMICAQRKKHHRALCVMQANKKD